VEMSEQPEASLLPLEAVLVDAKLEAIDLPTLLTICVDLLAVCAKRSAEIDPAVGAMVVYARNEILEHTNNDPSVVDWSASTGQTAIGRIKYVRN
jgi:hypothetical protein